MVTMFYVLLSHCQRFSVSNCDNTKICITVTGAFEA